MKEVAIKESAKNETILNYEIRFVLNITTKVPSDNRFSLVTS